MERPTERRAFPHESRVGTLGRLPSCRRRRSVHLRRRLPVTWTRCRRLPARPAERPARRLSKSQCRSGRERGRTGAGLRQAGNVIAGPVALVNRPSALPSERLFRMLGPPPRPDRRVARPTHPTAHPDHEEHVDGDPDGDRSSDVDQHRRGFLSAVPPTQPRGEAGHCHPASAKSTQHGDRVRCES
jgi:hypothetical protein